jgi:hypothetical protein
MLHMQKGGHVFGLTWKHCFIGCLTVAAHLRRETYVQLQATKTYNRFGDDPDAPDAASGAAAG